MPKKYNRPINNNKNKLNSKINLIFHANFDKLFFYELTGYHRHSGIHHVGNVEVADIEINLETASLEFSLTEEL